MLSFFAQEASGRWTEKKEKGANDESELPDEE